MSKGSGRRQEDSQKVRDNWDVIFGKKMEDAVKAETQKLREAGWEEIKQCVFPFCSCEKQCPGAK